MFEGLAPLSLFGGGFVITSIQWVSIRRFPQKIFGGLWAASGLASSGAAFLVIALSVLGPGDYPTHEDIQFFYLLIIFENLIILGITQGFMRLLMDSWKIKRGTIWANINAVRFIVISIVTCHLASKFGIGIRDNFDLFSDCIRS